MRAVLQNSPPSSANSHRNTVYLKLTCVRARNCITCVLESTCGLSYELVDLTVEMNHERDPIHVWICQSRTTAEIKINLEMYSRGNTSYYYAYSTCCMTHRSYA